MNILFFLTPKNEVAYIYDDFTLRQALEKIEYYRYSAVPIINHEGKYVGTITEGDILWGIKSHFVDNIRSAEDINIGDIKRKLDNKAIDINANIEDLVLMSTTQNFIPVTDDNGVFIGIITRKNIIQYCYDMYIKEELKNKVQV